MFLFYLLITMQLQIIFNYLQLNYIAATRVFGGNRTHKPHASSQHTTH